jgi:hypothetical protein
MSLKELEHAIEQLPQDEFRQFAAWFRAREAEAWDQQIEKDVKAGNLNELFRQANEDFEAGRYSLL